MQLFQNIDDPDYKDTKLSWAEKLIIKGIIQLLKIGLMKVARAKTYGDISNILHKIEINIDKYAEGKEFLDKDSDELTSEDVTDMLSTIDKVGKEL